MNGDTMFGASLLSVVLALGLSRSVKSLAGSWEHLFTWLGIFVFLVLVTWPILALLFSWGTKRGTARRMGKK